MTFDVAADLARLLAFDDFTGCFWGHVPDADDTAGATQTLKFPQVILSNKVKEWRKTQNVADKAAKCGNGSSIHIHACAQTEDRGSNSDLLRVHRMAPL